MSSVTPGRETDAAVARALGWVIETHDNKPPHFHRTENKSQWTWLEDWKPSTVEADAIAALEATGKDYTHRKLNGRHLVWFASVPSEGVPFATLCLAASAAILAWAEAKGSSK